MIKKTKKPTNTMQFVTAVINIRMNMTVLTNVSVVLNTTDGNSTMTKARENGNISARIARNDKNEE